MNFFNSEENPKETPAKKVAEPAGPTIRAALLKATEDVSPNIPVDVCVPSGAEEGEWVSALNDCHNKHKDFAHLGAHIKISKDESNGIVLTITDVSETMPKPQEMPKPTPPSTWPVGPATELSEEDSE
jgi:hypothetical protein